MNAKDYQELSKRTDVADYYPVRVRMGNDSFVRLNHAAMGLVTEAGEFTDQLKKHAMYGKTLDIVNLKEELGDLLWYVALACNELGVEMGAVMQTNIDKLKARFPEKFTESQAISRDLDKEREILEGL